MNIDQNNQPAQPYGQFSPPAMPSLHNPFGGLNFLSDEVSKKIEETINAKLDPLVKNMDAVKPIMEQHVKNEKQNIEANTKTSFLERMNQLMEYGRVAATVIDGQRLEMIYSTYKDLAADAFVRQDLGLAKKAIMNEALAFVRTDAGKKWLQTGIDAFFGMRARNFK